MKYGRQFDDNGLSGKKTVMMYDVKISLQASGGSSDTQMCHRFINFETFDKEIPEHQVQSIINDFV